MTNATSDLTLELHFYWLATLKTQSRRKVEDRFVHIFYLECPRLSLWIPSFVEDILEERCGSICPQLCLWIASSG